MIKRDDFIVENVAHHRNGCTGDGFHVVTFVFYGREMIATQFDERPMSTAVFERAELAAGRIEFGENSYRGDQFAKAISEVIAEYESFREIMA